MRGETADGSVPSTWIQIQFSRDDFEGGEVSVLESAFRRIYIASNGPRGMAMLGMEDGRTGGYRVYFTPQSDPYARALVRAYGGVAGEPPPFRRLSLIVGSMDN